jgi:hypothetical protein
MSGDSQRHLVSRIDRPLSVMVKGTPEQHLQA